MDCPQDPVGRDRQREETRRRVYLAALEIFRRDGFATCRIDDIAKLAAVSRGTFYFHFPTKVDVLVQRLREAECGVVKKLNAMPAGTRLAQVLDTTANAIADAWQGESKLVLDVAATGMRLAADALDREAEPVRAALTPFFRAAAERGELADLLPPEALTDFYLVNTLAAMVAWGGNPKLELRMMLQGVSTLFMTGAQGKARPGA